jgi:hypothetical protein
MLFRELNKISISTAVFAVMTLLVGYLATTMDDMFSKIELQLIAVVFLILFFYSLLKDKITEVKSGGNASVG